MIQPLIKLLNEHGFEKLAKENALMPKLNWIKHIPERKKQDYELYAYNGVGIIIENRDKIVDLFGGFEEKRYEIDIYGEKKSERDNPELFSRYYRSTPIPEKVKIELDREMKFIEGFRKVHSWQDNSFLLEYSFSELFERILAKDLGYRKQIIVEQKKIIHNA